MRGPAAGLEADAPVQQVTTDKVITVGVTDPVETVVEVMRAGAVRRGRPNR
ncbi:hypothetical protein [Promicromonospora sp. NPDC019610]|uniref:hypothetical protein n=1 Tax=Promicromonospora sp. NPDC019610 TaxID=3364405 RepID=UPI0037A4B0B5